MHRKLWIGGFLLLGLACLQEKPVRVENTNLGIVAVFPGEPKLHKFLEDTPFGAVEWFSTAYLSSSRMDESFFVNVGNLPAGTKGGGTPPEILATFQKFLTFRFGALDRTDLPESRGSGFRYSARTPDGDYVGGIAIYRRGRIHCAQGTVRKPEDPRLGGFLDSFAVAP